METFEELNEYNDDYDIDIIKPEKTNKFVCDECGESYKYHSGLYTHKRKHDVNYINKYSCSICEYSHDNIHHLYSHINAHNKKNEHAEIITNDRDLGRKPNKYKKMYDDKDKTFSCPICSKKYYYRQSIQVHMKTHETTRVFKFSCDSCDFKCDHKAQFGRHLKSHKN